MKEKITKNKTVFTGIIITFIFVLTLIGVSFAYFVTQVTGEGKDVNVTAGIRELTLSDNTAVDFGTIMPGWTDTTTLTVTNTGDLATYYNLVWENLTNTLTRRQDLTVSITSTNGGGTLSTTTVPASGSNINIISDILIQPNTSQTYTFTFSYAKSTTEDQTADANKTFSGVLDITASSRQVN